MNAQLPQVAHLVQGDSVIDVFGISAVDGEDVVTGQIQSVHQFAWLNIVFQIPWARLEKEWPEQLRQLGIKTAALALTDRSVSVDDPSLAAEPRLALVLGSEGDGLSDSVIESCDYTVKIPMSHGVDSLNVAAAAAVAFWELRIR